MEPSIKGTILVKLIEDAQRLLERREDLRERVEAEFSAATLALLVEPLVKARWYPIHHYRELTELLWREEGDLRVEYLHERGAAVMKRLMEGGVYQQLDYLHRTTAGGPSANQDRERVLAATKLVGSLMGVILNFSKHEWYFDPKQPDHLLHEISEAAAFPEVLRFVQEGAETYLVRQGRPDAPPVTSERVAADRIILTSDYTGAFGSEP